ncbi:MAG: hypothetical protein HQL71_06875 [Magnetococcales bacterium]|nr:hypothetical protein [Magnetococcales bacterium]
MLLINEENMDQTEITALSKIRNKTCIPSLLWQRLTTSMVGNDIEPVLMRTSVYKRLKPHLIILKNKGYFKEVEVKDVNNKPGWVELVINGVGEKFSDIL